MKNMNVSALALCSLAAWSSGTFNPAQANTEEDTLDALPNQFNNWSDADSGSPLVTIETVSGEWENASALDPFASGQEVIEWSSDLEAPEFVNTVVNPAAPSERAEIETADAMEAAELETIDVEVISPIETSPLETSMDLTLVGNATASPEALSSTESTESIKTGYVLMEPLVANIPDSHPLATTPADTLVNAPQEEKTAAGPLAEQPAVDAIPLDVSLAYQSAIESSVVPSIGEDAGTATTATTDAVVYSSASPFSATNTSDTNLLATNIVASSVPTLGIPEPRFDLAQLPLEPPILEPSPVNEAEVEQLINEIDQIDADTSTPYRSSPAITISNPSGFGADNFTGFVGIGYQERTRFANEDDGGVVVGMGFGDARENVGFQLSYTVASFGGSRDFGTGGFNAKLHRRLSDEWSVAVGWEGFATTGFVDFEDSIYGSASHLIRTRDSITKPFSRIALTAGAGSGRFRTEDAVFEDRDDIGVFGSMSVRVVEPVSAIVEWTGQDLAAGLSITPFKKIPLVLVPAVRDITGAGDGARFVMGAGFSFQL